MGQPFSKLYVLWLSSQSQEIALDRALSILLLEEPLRFAVTEAAFDT